MSKLQFLQEKLKTIPNVGINTSPAALSEGVRQLKNIPVSYSRQVLGTTGNTDCDWPDRILLQERPSSRHMRSQLAKYGWSQSPSAELVSL